MNIICSILLGAALVGAAGLSGLAATPLPDQLGGSDSLAAHRGNAVVVVVVDARRLGTVRRWAQDLVTRFPKLHLLTVADVNESKPTSLERVASVLARRAPPDVPVLIDMQRLWALGLELDTSAPNLLVVAPDGALVGSWRGRWSPQLGDEVSAALGALGAST